MASSYALPSSPLPHHHKHPHSHSHSHSPQSMSTLKGRTLSNGSIPAQSHGHGHAHSYGGHASQPGHQASPNYPDQQPRSRMAPPAPLTILEGWKEESTPGGRKVLTPASVSFPTTYQPPQYPTNDSYHHVHMHDHHHDHDHDHHHGHGHGRNSQRSVVTRFLLKYTARWPLLHTIMTEKDSRRILYYMLLNVSFMLVQAFYGYVTDSLGLLSDTIHMFFDCVALLVGLIAAVASKWPASQRFPYGLGKMETLSGFANGILLILLSVEITFEAFERLWEGSKPKRLGELLVVSVLGMLVNLVGVFAFGHHHHHGHGHSHSHGHGHGHSHEHNHSHSHHSHSHSHGHDDCTSHKHAGAHGHSHSHDNENMHGIYLHVLADTLGSASVVVSTILTSIYGWAGWDPLASVFISVLIVMSSKPLIISSSKRLLLGIPDDVEYNLRDTLSGIMQQRGVVGCSVPKFWVDDRGGGDDGDRLLGIVHVVAARGASLDDVRDRVRDFMLKSGMDIVVQVEREGDPSCWCGVNRTSVMPLTPRSL